MSKTGAVECLIKWCFIKLKLLVCSFLGKEIFNIMFSFFFLNNKECKDVSCNSELFGLSVNIMSSIYNQKRY